MRMCASRTGDGYGIRHNPDDSLRIGEKNNCSILMVLWRLPGAVLRRNRLARPQPYGELASRGAPVDRHRLLSANSLLHQGQPSNRLDTIAAYITSPTQPTSYCHGRPHGNGGLHRFKRRPTSLQRPRPPRGTGTDGHGGLHRFTYTANPTEAAATTGMAAAPQLQWPRAVLANSGHD